MALSVPQHPTAIITDAGGATVNISFSSLPTVGSGIGITYAAGTGSASDPGTPSAADNQGAGHTYGIPTGANAKESSANQRAVILRLSKILAASGTFTVTVTHGVSSNVYSVISMAEVATSGAGITTDQGNSGTVTTGTPVTAVVTTTNDNEVWFSSCTVDGSNGNQGIGTAFSGGTQIMISQDDTLHCAAGGDYKVSSAAGATASYAITAGHNAAVAVIATFSEASSGVSAALVGQAATFTAGTLTPNLSIPLTGQAATFSAGSLTPLISPALTGQSATFTPGTLTANLSIPLTGQSFAFTPGSLTPSSSTDVTAALTGQAFTFSQGALTADLTATLAGQPFAFSQGTISPASADVAAPITGQRASFSQGRLTPLVENRGRSSRHQRPWWYRNYDDELERLERERRERVRLGIITIPQSRRIKQSIETAQEDLEEALLFAMNEQLVESARVMQSVSGRIDKLVARLHIERRRKEDQDIEDDDEETVLSLLPYM